MIYGKGCVFHRKDLSNIGDCVIGDNCTIHSHVWIGDKVSIGNRCKIQAYTFIPTGVRIGNNVFVGPRVTFTNDRHPPSGGDWSPTIILDNVVIGAGAVILPGITLGVGCFIGAGAVVTKSVPAGTTVCGNPAKSV